jgi:2-hydroxychromene-2-carboxylate isomerase
MTIDWYFDFVSPYSFLQSERLASSPVAVRARPIVFAGLLQHWGQKGPAEMATKRTFTYRHVQWVAQRDGVRLRFPPRHPFNPIRALRLAVALGSTPPVVQAIFRHAWREGEEIDTVDGFARLCGTLGVADGEARIARPEVKDELRRNGEEAIARGVFGVPTLCVDGELFWGYDATDMALDFIRDPGRFRSGEMRRVDNLPVGATRS